MTFNGPFFFTPLLVERIWGGNRLEALFGAGKKIPAGKTIGESWELCDRPDAQTRVARGPHVGNTLRELLERNAAAVLGPKLAAKSTQRFPLLIKFIDAGTALSVQVHPDDAGARAYKDRGKTECWVVLHAESHAQIIRGLKPGITRARFEAAVNAGCIEETLHSFTPKVGDVVALPPGMVHAIGAGLTVAEIQQNSDVTLRIYDYNRVGLDGKPRQLHIKESFETIRFDGPGTEFEGDMRRDTVVPLSREKMIGGSMELLLRSQFFDLRRYVVAANAIATLPAKSDAPRVVMCLEGAGTFGGEEIKAGDTALLPAAAPALELKNSGKNELVVLVSAPTESAF